jgi:phosphate transport system permease protein
MPGSDRLVVGRPVVGPGLLVTAGATLAVVALLAGLLWVVAVNALRWFWPASVWQLELVDGRVVVGEVVENRRLPRRDADHADRRFLFKTGNREVTGRDHLWLLSCEVEGADAPESAVRVTRSRNGDAFGWIRVIVDLDGRRWESVDRRSVEPIIAEAAELRAEVDSLRREIERRRRPLTRLEHRAARFARSERGRSNEGRARADALDAEIARVRGELEPGLRRLERRLAAIRARLGLGKLELHSGDDRIIVPFAEMLEVEWPNARSFGGRLAVAIGAFGRFLVTEPREANTEGGIFPALFGTVLLVLLMSLAVMPLGVLTAVYMTEYARPGPALTIAHHAVNNLAGVPSIVIGIFGLTFFVYGIGGGLDRMFFGDELPQPTFGTGGILWASLTLALLTVPVVVVATREGLLAVPPGWREGALALGATRWQTLRRVVLPAAVPGILTGLILAVGRAVGEVAPLMLTGAVKLAPSLPVDGTAPFVHLERKFMHLGFFVFDVSMQSPNVEAAKPIAFAATLVLLLLVLTINLAAIIIRRRLRLAYRLLEI